MVSQFGKTKIKWDHQINLKQLQPKARKGQTQGKFVSRQICLGTQMMSPSITQILFS